MNTIGKILYSLTAIGSIFILNSCKTESVDNEQYQNTSLQGPPCENTLLNPNEKFGRGDKPSRVSIDIFEQNITTPWGYNKTENSKRLYPIVVNGCWGEGPLFNDNVRQKYPAFYMTFQKCSSDSEGALLADIIDAAHNQGLRVDESRIYLTGFSKGGSGSYKLVRGFYSKRKLFAGIIRIAGQSESVLIEPAVEKTSIWYHIGLKDKFVRVEVARKSYDYLKRHPLNKDAAELRVKDIVSGYNRLTKTLSFNGIEIMKLSEYGRLGHDVGPVYDDPMVFDWLFAQSLSCREK